jgi:outer membrane protein assembly factor BamB
MRPKRMRRNVRTTLIAAAALALVASRSSAQEWTRFRGPNGTGISAAKSIPVQLSPGDYNWTVELPGRGHSSPVVWGNRVFVTSAEEQTGKRHLLCLSTKDGKELWRRTYDFKPYHLHDFNAAAASTPTADSERVYVVLPEDGRFLVAAIDHQGREVWQRDLGAFPTQHGGSSSPILVGDVLVINNEPEDANGSLVGLDRKTGAILWQRKRNSQACPYATPAVYQPPDGPAEVIFASTAHGLTSVDPETGDLNWEADGLTKLRCVASPLIVDGLVYQASGVGDGSRQAVAVRPGSKKSGTAAKVEYRIARGPSYVPTPIAVSGRIYAWGDAGIVTCMKAATGEIVWQERVGGSYFGSPVCADGKLYAISAKGELVVIEAGEQFKILGRSDLGEGSHATPAISDGIMYLRTTSHLISVGGRK